MDIYERIDLLLSERGMSRRKMAEKAGVPFSTISSAFARRSRGISVEVLAKIAAALDVDLGLILGIEDGKVVQNLFRACPDFEISKVVREGGKYRLANDGDDSECGPYSEIIRLYSKLSGVGQAKVIEYLNDISGKYPRDDGPNSTFALKEGGADAKAEE